MVNSGEAFRPIYHYTPQTNWLNDPNGLFYLDGTYHMFYQYNPFGDQWGNISWGHATSRDLVDWTELDVALPATDTEMYFSGSAVVDHNNTSGFGYGVNGEPPIVAIYTSFIPATAGQTYDQNQAIAYSLDGGNTWTPYSGNPVIDDASNEFRDPKVFWQDDATDPDGGYWVMGVVKAVERVTEFYRSDDLREWTFLSDFGPANAVGGVWEVPDLIEMTVENTGETKYLLVQNLNPGGIQGGSAAQYFIGDWDGTTFTADNVRASVPPGGTVFEDFESGTYDAKWIVESGVYGTTGAFGAAPVAGTLPGQNAVALYQGQYLANSFLNDDGSVGDGGTGRLISTPFTITDDYINLLVGGGGHAWDLSIVDDIGAPGGEVIADFDFGVLPTGWVGTGDFANIRPVPGGNAPGQNVDGYDGAGLINTFNNPSGFDAPVGTVESPVFQITRDFINLRVGGGQWDGVNHPDPITRVELLVDDGSGFKVVGFASGQNTNSLRDVSWDVSAYRGMDAQIIIRDDNPGGWGQILVDSIEQNDFSVLNLPPTSATIFEDWESSGALPTTWTATGDFANGFGTATGSQFGQQGVSGFLGGRLLNTFWEANPGSGPNGDFATGEITSQSFTVTEDFINLLVGGGGNIGVPDETTVNLIVGSQVVRTSAGGYTENLTWTSWDVSQFAGQQAQIKIIDANPGGWGHILVDQIELADSARLREQADPTAVNLIVDGQRVATATGSFGEGLDWRSWDVSQYLGKQAQIEIVDDNTGGWGHINVDQITFSDQAAIPSELLGDWVDYGADNYATITWANLPDGSKPTAISWMNNWTYSSQIPTDPFRGAMTLPREFSLVEIDGEIRLVQTPVQQLQDYRREHVRADGVTIGDGTINAPMDGKALEIEAIFDASTASATEFGFKVRVGAGEETAIGYDMVTGEVFVDRTTSGQIPNPVFAAVHSAPLEIMDDGRIKLHIFVDTASVEVFANGGLRTITDQIFPDEDSVGVQIYAEGGEVGIDSLDIWKLSTEDYDVRAPRTYTGTDNSDMLTAIEGAKGQIKLEGFAGDDILIGTDARETMYGGDGRDELRGGGGRNDQLWGGGDADLFVFGDELSNGRRENIFIRDFEVGVDKVDLGGASVIDIRQVESVVEVFLSGDGDKIVFSNLQDLGNDWIA